MKYCIDCGTQLLDDASFCHKCGARQIEKPVFTGAQSVGAAGPSLRRGIAFLDNWLAMTAVIVLATITTILFAVGSQGFAAWDAMDVMRQFCLVGALAVTALVSTRTGGLDLSVGGMMALSSLLFAINASANNAGVGFLLALVVCGSVGLLNGMFIMVARMPAILVTVTSAMLTRGIALWASGGVAVPLPAEWTEWNVAAPVLALLVSVGVAIYLLWRTGGFATEKKTVRGEMKFFWIYGLIAAMGALAGWAAAISFGAADVGIGAGSSNEMVLLFIFAMISATGLLKNNWIALGWVLVIAMLWTIHDQAMILLALNPFSWIVSNASWVFIMLAVMAIAKRSWKKPPWVNAGY